MSMKDLLYRVLRHSASPVTVITTAWESQLAGMTISSLTSLSMGPPDLFMTFNCQIPSRTAEIMHRRNRAVLNMLSATPENVLLAKAFAGRLREGHEMNPFDRYSHLFGTTERTEGIPTINGAAAQLLCDIEKTVRVQDHEIVVARVRDVLLGSLDPLIYHEHRFRELGPEIEH